MNINKLWVTIIKNHNQVEKVLYNKSLTTYNSIRVALQNLTHSLNNRETNLVLTGVSLVLNENQEIILLLEVKPLPKKTKTIIYVNKDDEVSENLPNESIADIYDM